MIIMHRITTDQTISFTKDLSILYAEDDVELQEQTKDFFEVLFKRVVTVNNGADALTKYKEEQFDIVISDVKMPLMNGIELATRIREINPIQSIIIVSAYNDSESLVQFINLNVQQFIQKPIDVDNMLETLYLTSKAIVNEERIENYKQEIEASNIELTKKNNELNSVIRILDSKIVQPLKDNEYTNNIEDGECFIEENDLKDLKRLELDITHTSILMSIKNNHNQENIQGLSTLLLAYSTTLKKYAPYNDFSLNIQKLAESISLRSSDFIKNVTSISKLLESFTYVLRIWRNNIESSAIEDAFNLQTSMMIDVSSIVSILKGENNDK